VLFLFLSLFPSSHPAEGGARPLVAVVAEDDGTEITDFVVPYSVLVQSGRRRSSTSRFTPARCASCPLSRSSRTT
jgi:hypothetical protein